MTARERLEKAKRVLKEARSSGWLMAKLTWEAVEYDGWTRTGWAAELGCSPKTTGRWYQLWSDWGGNKWSELPEYTEAYNELDGRGTAADRLEGRRIGKLSPERKVAIVREALADRKVADAVAKDAETRHAVMDAVGRVASAKKGTPAERRAVEESFGRVRKAAGELARDAAVAEVERAAGALHRVVESEAEFTKREYKRIVKAVRAMAEDVVVYASRGGLDDEGLAELLKGGLA